MLPCGSYPVDKKCVVSVTIFLVLAFVVFILLVFAFRSSGSSRQEVIKSVRGWISGMAVWADANHDADWSDIFNRFAASSAWADYFGPYSYHVLSCQMTMTILTKAFGSTVFAVWGWLCAGRSRQANRTIGNWIRRLDWINTRRRQQQDEKDKALLSAGISILRIDGEAMRTLRIYAAKILAVLG